MSRFISSQWPGNPFAPYRQGRMPCGYEAYVPDLLAGRAIGLDGDVAADVSEAEARGAGEIVVDEGDGAQRVVAFLEQLKVV